MIIQTYYGHYLDLAKVVALTPLYQNSRGETCFGIQMAGAASERFYLAEMSIDKLSANSELVRYQKAFGLDNYRARELQPYSKEEVLEIRDNVAFLHDAFVEQWKACAASREAAGVKLLEIIERNPSATLVLTEMLDKLVRVP